VSKVIPHPGYDNFDTDNGIRYDFMLRKELSVSKVLRHTGFYDFYYNYHIMI
jgi:hypothetical protein